MNIIYKKTGELIPYANNPHLWQKAVGGVKESIKAFGFRVPVIIDMQNVIIAGHARVNAAELLGIEHIPCIVADDLTAEQIQAFRLADNKVAELSSWDKGFLAEELEILANVDFDMTNFGFEFTPQVLEDEFCFKENFKNQTSTSAGDMFLLGKHRLLCGDSTNKACVEKLMGEELASLLITDPPYNVDYHGKTSENLTMENDCMNENEYMIFLTTAFKNAYEVMEKGAAFYIWHADNFGYAVRGACRDAGLRLRQCLVWIKNGMVIGRQDYHWQHEPCLYGWKDGTHFFTKDRTQTTAINMCADVENMRKDELREYIYSSFETSSVLFENKPLKNDMHPTMKPISLISKQIGNSTKSGAVVLDLFGGSGSSLITCEQLGRECRMIEYDGRYCDVIIKRWEDFTGKKAVKI